MAEVAGWRTVQGDVPGGVDLRASAHDGRRPDGAGTGRWRRSSRTRSRSSAAGGRRDRGRRPVHPVRLPPLPVSGRSRLDRAVRGGGPRIDDLVDRALAADRRCWRDPGRRHGRRCTSAAGTTGPRGCARARWSRSPSASSASCRTTRSWSSGTTSAATAASSRSASCATAPSMVMGIVSTKTRELEDEDDLLAADGGGGGARRRHGPAGDQPAMRVRERHGRQRDRRGHPMAQAGAGGRVADRLWGRA